VLMQAKSIVASPTTGGGTGGGGLCLRKIILAQTGCWAPERARHRPASPRLPAMDGRDAKRDVDHGSWVLGAGGGPRSAGHLLAQCPVRWSRARRSQHSTVKPCANMIASVRRRPQAEDHRAESQCAASRMTSLAGLSSQQALEGPLAQQPVGGPATVFDLADEFRLRPAHAFFGTGWKLFAECRLRRVQAASAVRHRHICSRAAVWIESVDLPSLHLYHSEIRRPTQRPAACDGGVGVRALTWSRRRRSGGGAQTPSSESIRRRLPPHFRDGPTWKKNRAEAGKAAQVPPQP
jgi:hypothetical protein